MEFDVPKLKIRIEPAGDTGVPIDMLHSFFIAHEATLEFVIREECNKEGSIPELRIIDVYHGSWEFEFLVQGLQAVLPFTKGYLTKMASKISESLSGLDTFEETETTTTTTSTTRTRRLPKHVSKKLSKPFDFGLIKRVEAFENDNQTPLYSISNEQVIYKPIESDLVLTPETTTIEHGEVQELTGELREIDWEKRTCRFLVELDGVSKSYKCIILDEVFLDEEVRNRLLVKMFATPVYQTTLLGERNIKYLEAKEISKIEV